MMEYLRQFFSASSQYSPYDTHEEFGRGFSAYQAGNFRNPHEADSISAQAWDQGVDAANRY